MRMHIITIQFLHCYGTFTVDLPTCSLYKMYMIGFDTIPNFANNIVNTDNLKLRSKPSIAKIHFTAYGIHVT